MSSFRIRPRFKHLVNEEQDALESRILEAMKVECPPCVPNATKGYINLRIPVDEQHFWSPQLTMTFETTEEGTVVRGLYGPNPTVWAIFFFGYVAVGILGSIAAMWGFARMNLDMSYEILWAVPVFAAIALGLYIASQFGQKLGAEQMFRLHHFYEDVVHDKISVE
jgi:hypothetical protein